MSLSSSSSSLLFNVDDLDQVLDLEILLLGGEGQGQGQGVQQHNKGIIIEKVCEKKKLAAIDILARIDSGARAGAGSRGRGEGQEPGYVFSKLLFLSRRFRGQYDAFLSLQARRNVDTLKSSDSSSGSSGSSGGGGGGGGGVDENLVYFLLKNAFDTVFDWLASYCTTNTNTTEPFAEKSHWVVCHVLAVMSNLEFCRQQSHLGYIALLNSTIPLLKESEAAAKLCWSGLLEDILGEHQEHVKDVLLSFTTKSKTYFFLRLFPSMAGQLGDLLLDTQFLDLLMVCCELPAVQMKELTRCAHDCMGTVFAEAPFEIQQETFPRYLDLSLRLYPDSTPHDSFALAVLSLAKRSDLMNPLALLCATRVADKADVLEAKGMAERASALRKLHFGLMNVVPLGALNDLLHLYERRYSIASPEQKAKFSFEIAVVLDVNKDYFRKPHLAAWYQHLSTHYSNL